MGDTDRGAGLVNYLRTLKHQAVESEERAAHAEVLVKWQRSLIADLRTEGRDPAPAEQVLEVLIESRAWFTGLAQQAVRDLTFVRRHSASATSGSSGRRPDPQTATAKAG